MAQLIDMTGLRFGRLLVVNLYCKGKTSKWICRCDCGKTTIVTSQNLRKGKTKSCGCYNSEVTSRRNMRHGKSNTRLYKTWKGMIRRCYNANGDKYPNYGGRGITVCPEWRYNFEHFYQWAMEKGCNDTLTIDRIDVNGNYEPLNCRWATPREQANNKTDNHILRFRGIKKTVAEWADVVGMDKKLIYDRIKYGWSIERALTEKKNNTMPPENWEPEEDKQ